MNIIPFSSNCLNTTVEIGFVLPDKCEHMLIMLHGYGGTLQDVDKLFLLNEYAENLNMLIVVPEVGNQYYLDRYVNGTPFTVSTFLSYELPVYIRSLFGLEEEVDIILAGYSMGGFGTILHGLNNPECFSALISVSGAFAAHEIAYGSNFIVGREKQRRLAYDIFMIEDGQVPYDVLSTDIHRNPLAILESMEEDKIAVLPTIFLTCGSKDIWCSSTLRLYNELEKKHVAASLLQLDGDHDFTIFDKGFRWAFDKIFNN